MRTPFVRRPAGVGRASGTSGPVVPVRAAEVVTSRSSGPGAGAPTAGFRPTLSARPTSLPASQALLMATRLGAQALHIGHLTGSLTPNRRADLILVPTESARQRAINCHIDPQRVQVVGLPVADQYCKPPADKRVLRERLGWPLEKPVVLMVGGGEGMGPLGKVAMAVDDSGLDVGLVIVAGRNHQLKQSLEAHKWDNPAFIYGFTREMPDFMRAADFIVTKAGPGTISEALNAHLPIILYSKLPGQEDGNVTFVVNEGAGVWAPTPQLVVRALTRWISRPHEKQKIVETCAALARPEAARLIARSIAMALVHTQPREEAG